MPVGQIVARGVIDAAGTCAWIGTQGLQTAQGQWMALHVDADCVARIAAKWTGGLSGGPQTVTSGIVAAVGDVGDVGTVGTNAMPSADALTTTCKTSKEYVYTYGGLGPIWDKLTVIWSALTYCYNDSFVWGTSTAGSACAGTPEAGWNWVVDACAFSDQSLGSNSTKVWSTLKGTYHCDPVANFPCNVLNGYHHHLYAKVVGFQSGHASCTFWWDGSIVFGPNQDVISGCV
jgi:hypothetical protein